MKRPETGLTIIPENKQELKIYREFIKAQKPSSSEIAVDLIKSLFGNRLFQSLLATAFIEYAQKMPGNNDGTISVTQDTVPSLLNFVFPWASLFNKKKTITISGDTLVGDSLGNWIEIAIWGSYLLNGNVPQGISDIAGTAVKTIKDISMVSGL